MVQNELSFLNVKSDLGNIPVIFVENNGQKITSIKTVFITKSIETKFLNE